MSLIGRVWVMGAGDSRRYDDVVAPKMMPDGMSGDGVPVCVGLIDDGVTVCGEPAEFVGSAGTGWAGCFCAECKEAIGDIFDHWRQL